MTAVLVDCWLIGVLLAPVAASAQQETRGAPLTVSPGAIVRWPDPTTSLCGMDGASWTPLDGACWYPIDLLTPEGPLTLWRRRGSEREEVTVQVGPYGYPVQRLQVEQAMVDPPAVELERIRHEQRLVAALWHRDRARGFTLPLAPPLEPMTAGGRFGSRRILNGEPRSPHSGIDLTAPKGTAVHAAGAGRVVLAEPLYFSGNSVFIDHGDELVSMYFHLSRLLVAEGAEVSRGQLIGRVGATGRATGPHLHFAIRWHGARVDPRLLLADPASLPRISPASPR